MRFYVYALVDPRTGEEFYYGKGTGKRAYAHVKEYHARRVTNFEKFCRIDEIVRAGHSVEVRFIKQGMTEHDAFRLEAKLIREARRSRPITNWVAGVDNPKFHSASGLQRTYRKVNDLLQRARPLRQWLRYVACTEKRKPTRDDVRHWFETMFWLADLRREIRGKMIEVGQVLSHQGGG